MTQRLKHIYRVLPTLLAAVLAGCAQVPTQTAGGSATLSYADAQSRYQQGLNNYKENRPDTALGDLSAALNSGHLKTSDALNARKHIAFIHCTNDRELLCREQFQMLLKTQPNFDMSPSEAGHPLWGPVWRSTKGAAEEQRAVTQASSGSASPAQQKLAEGIKEYEAGLYKESLEALQEAFKAGLPSRPDELRAHKYVAFIYCLTQRPKQCRAEFKLLFSKEPSYELLPSEVGHPAWATIYRSEKTAVKPPESAPKADETKNEAKAANDEAKKTEVNKKTEANKSLPKNEPKVEPKKVPKAEPKPEPKSESKPEPKPGPGPGPKK